MAIEPAVFRTKVGDSSSRYRSEKDNQNEGPLTHILWTPVSPPVSTVCVAKDAQLSSLGKSNKIREK
jgi:hypothetical protein